MTDFTREQNKKLIEHISKEVFKLDEHFSFEYGARLDEIREIIDSMTEPENEEMPKVGDHDAEAAYRKRKEVEKENTLKYKAGDGRRYRWDGIVCGMKGKIVQSYDPQDVDIIDTIEEVRKYPYKITASDDIDWWVSEASLTPIEDDEFEEFCSMVESMEDEPPDKTPLQIARGLAAQAWCHNETLHLDMIPELAEAFAHILVPYVRKGGDTKPADKPDGLKVGDFVCQLSKNDNSVYELVFINRYNVAYIKTVLEGLSVDVNISNIRHATDKDWEVEIDGVTWRAEYDSTGWVQIYMNDYHVRFFDKDGMLCEKEDNNRAMESICKDKNIPIKLYEGE